MCDQLLLHGYLLTDAEHPPLLGWVQIDGDRISEIGHGQPPHSRWIGGPDSLICPGFVDAHTHPPQFAERWDAVGCEGLSLLKWLDQLIYPAEMAWADPAAATRLAAIALRRMLKAGTLGFAGFLTSHPHALAALVAANRTYGLRWIAGTMLMDREGPPELISFDQSRAALHEQITSIQQQHGESTHQREQVSINPRFAITCSNSSLSQAGGLASDLSHAAYIQTHLAESPDEVQLVGDLFPNDSSYAAVYDRHGLLTAQTLLAHCLHLDPQEWQLIAARESMIVHCPTANTFLQAGHFDWRTSSEHNIRVGLGSDVAAGPDVAMPRVARAMMDVAKLRRMTVDPSALVPTPSDAWRLITRGNAELLGWDDAGCVQPGYSADLLILKPDLPLDDWLISRLLYTWQDDYITHRIVAGRLLHVG